jgi:septal ring factor EnvC (AmiA/AmiB activator)
MFVLYAAGLDSGARPVSLSQRDLAAVRKAPDRQLQQQQVAVPVTATSSQSGQDPQEQLAAIRQQAALQEELAARSQQLQERTDQLGQAQSELNRLNQQIASLRQELQEADPKQQRRDLVAAHERQGPEEVALEPQKNAKSNTKRLRGAAKATQPQPPSPAQALAAARQLLAAGRLDEARRLLAMAQTEMVLRPVTPDEPHAHGISMNATAVGDAIRWLDMDAPARAMQAIDWAIEQSSAPTARVSSWPGYWAGR